MHRTARPLALLCACASAPIALGIAMHLEHLEAARACAAELACTTNVAVAAETAPAIVLAMPTPVAAVPASAQAPELVGPGAGAYDFAHVVHLDGPHIVLATDTDERWAADAAHRRSETLTPWDYRVWRTAAIERLPELPRAAIGRAVDVYTPGGRVCTARIGTPSLVAERSGAFQPLDEEELEIDNDDGDEPPVIPPATVWQEGRHLLVAPLVDGGDCADAVWARDAALPRPLIYVAQESNDRPSSAAQRLLQRDPATREHVASLAALTAEAEIEPFTAQRLARSFVGVRWIEPTRGGELDVFTTEGDDFGGCGGFDPVWGAVALDAFGTPTRAWLHPDSDGVRAVVDLEGDGRPEVIADTWTVSLRLFALDEGIDERSSLPEVPYYGCPC